MSPPIWFLVFIVVLIFLCLFGIGSDITDIKARISKIERNTQEKR